MKQNNNEYWELVGSQAVQDIVQRIDRAYQLFFKHHKKAVEARVADRRKGMSTKRGVRPPNFRKRIKYKSFTLKQAGYKFLEDSRLKIGKRIFKFWKSREIEGKIKTITIKRNPLGELFIFVVTDFVDTQVSIMTGKSAGFDFGCKVFLTCSDNSEIKSPLFLKQSLKEVKLSSLNHSRKQKRSNNREKARKHLVRVHEKVANRRRDWFWKLAHELTDKFDYLFFETLNLKGMQRLWGRKISDLAFAEFLEILDFVATKKGKTVGYIDRWYPSTKTCSECNYVLDELDLSERYWVCPSCSTKQGRDSNSSRVIHKVGASTLGLGDVSRLSDAIAV